MNNFAESAAELVKNLPLANNGRVRSLQDCFETATDRKSLLALRGVGPESEAESVRFHGAE